MMKEKNNISNIVLIVDDSPDTLGMLNDALEKSNMTTLVALEGKQAISIAKKMQPDVILLDAIMPNMDGFETCKAIKSDPDLKNTPIIFMTGLSDTESIVKGFGAGGVDFLTKPINPQELIARLNVHLLNARATLSAQTALDSAGQNIFAIDNLGKKLWSTPAVNQHLAVIDKSGLAEAFEQQLANWLSHSPNNGNKMHFSSPTKEFTAVYFGLSDNLEHLIRLVDDAAADETTVLRNHFGLTVRESDVYLWLTKGKTNREIAQILDMSPRTVNKHLEPLFRKLGVDNRTSAATMAMECLLKKVIG
jgi:DNA-binding response OmpR family regulator/DNA-binding CsgD family transcriptional regulator